MTAVRNGDRRRIRWGVAAAVAASIVLLASGGSQAVQPDEMLKDPALEARARAISQQLRCVVCQNQSIDDSNAELARDLRIIVRERLVRGDSDEEAMDFIVTRYGNFVLLKPPFHANTLVLWLGPALLLIAAALGFGALLRGTPGRAGSAPAELTPEERQRVADLLERGTSS